MWFGCHRFWHRWWRWNVDVMGSRGPVGWRHAGRQSLHSEKLETSSSASMRTRSRSHPSLRRRYVDVRSESVENRSPTQNSSSSTGLRTTVARTSSVASLAQRVVSAREVHTVQRAASRYVVDVASMWKRYVLLNDVIAASSGVVKWSVKFVRVWKNGTHVNRFSNYNNSIDNNIIVIIIVFINLFSLLQTYCWDNKFKPITICQHQLWSILSYLNQRRFKINDW